MRHFSGGRCPSEPSLKTSAQRVAKPRKLLSGGRPMASRETTFSQTLSNDAHAPAWLAKEAVQNVRLRYREHRHENRQNRDRLPANIGVEPALLNMCAASASASTRSASHAWSSKIVAGFVAGDAGRCLAHRVIIAESLQASLTLRHAEAEAWQHLAQSVDANPDVICPRHRLDGWPAPLPSARSRNVRPLFCVAKASCGRKWQP